MLQIYSKSTYISLPLLVPLCYKPPLFFVLMTSSTSDMIFWIPAFLLWSVFYISDKIILYKTNEITGLLRFKCHQWLCVSFRVVDKAFYNLTTGYFFALIPSASTTLIPFLSSNMTAHISLRNLALICAWNDFLPHPQPPPSQIIPHLIQNFS